MNVTKIEISDLHFDSKLGLHRADVVLVMIDPGTQTEQHVHLHCTAGDQPGTEGESVSDRLILDAARQMSWMPEYRSGGRKLTFPESRPETRVA